MDRPTPISLFPMLVPDYSCCPRFRSKPRLAMTATTSDEIGYAPRWTSLPRRAVAGRPGLIRRIADCEPDYRGSQHPIAEKDRAAFLFFPEVIPGDPSHSATAFLPTPTTESVSLFD